jgi:hypothetical protein
MPGNSTRTTMSLSRSNISIAGQRLNGVPIPPRQLSIIRSISRP